MSAITISTPAPAPTDSAPPARLPSDATMRHAVKFAIEDDKPIAMDYWVDSVSKECMIGIRENEEKLLVKSGEEFTTPIGRVAQSGNELILATENTIYIVCKDIPRKRVR